MKNKERKKEGKGCHLLRESDDGKNETEEKVLHQRLVQTHAKMQPFSVSMQNPEKPSEQTVRTLGKPHIYNPTSIHSSDHGARDVWTALWI